MNNPFYVSPQGGASLGQNLAGLGQILETKREEEKALKASEEAQNAVLEAYQSGDPNRMAEASIKYPQLGETIRSAMGIKTDSQNKEFNAFTRQVLSDPERAPEYYEQRIQMLDSQGRDSTQTRQSYQDFLKDSNSELKEMEVVYATNDKEGYDAFRDIYRQEGPKASTDLGKLKQDLDAGFISQEQYDGKLKETLGPEGVDQRERKINDYMDLFSLDRESAVKRVDSEVRLDEQGNLIEYDPTSGSGRLVDVERTTESTQRPTLKPTELKDLGFDPAKGTGFGAAALNVYNSTLGQIPFAPTLGRDKAEASQKLRFLERDAINALATSQRPSVVEQERIMNIIPQADDWFENPDIARQDMTQFVDIMVNEYIADLRYADDPNNDRASRNASRSSARAVEGIMRRTLTPEAADEIFNSIDRTEAANGKINELSFDEVVAIDPSSLSDEEFEIYFERLNSGQ